MITQNNSSNSPAKTVGQRHTVGFVLSNEQWRINELVKQAVAAENAGFDMVWTSDHFHPWQDNQGHAGHAWILLAAIGQSTKRVPFGTGVTCPTYRNNPAVVAQAFASLGILNPERVFLGIGAGEALNEEASGGGWDEYDIRAERLEEAVQIIKKLWKGDWMSFTGKHYQIPRARLFDVPQTPVPLYMAASGPNSSELAGQYGDGWITEPKNALDPEARGTWEKAVRDSGRDPAALPIICELFVFVGSKQDPELQKAANLWRFLPKAWTDFVDNPDPSDIRMQAEEKVSLEEVTSNWLIGDNPQVFIDRILELFDGGVTQVFIHSAQTDQQRIIDFFGQQVLPQVRSQIASRTRTSAR
jgi:F420-dependent hydroxymycolic acid dehydrogenase